MLLKRLKLWHPLLGSPNASRHNHAKSTSLIYKPMLYRLQRCQSQPSSNNTGSDAMLYKGVDYSSASRDLDEKRLFFSQAISHNSSDRSEEGETFRTQSEWDQVRQELQLPRDGNDTQSTHDRFIERGDQYARSCYFISSWSFSESIASQFAYQFSDKAVLSIAKDDLESAFQGSVTYWNSRQPGEWEMINDDGSQNLDWDPRYVGYATGSVNYVKPSELSGFLPFRLARAMRLPDYSKNEEEWRIALDLSLVPSSVATAALLEAELMPSFLTEAMRPTHESLHAEPEASQAELRPMIEISTTNFPNYERGLWLNNCDLRAHTSFQFHRL